MNPSWQTKEAAQYLTGRGVTTSQSKLEKLRLRGPDDPRDSGPNWSRDEVGRCQYLQSDLDAYIAKRLAARQFRASAAQPENFSRRAG